MCSQMRKLKLIQTNINQYYYMYALNQLQICKHFSFYLPYLLLIICIILLYNKLYFTVFYKLSQPRGKFWKEPTTTTKHFQYPSSNNHKNDGSGFLNFTIYNKYFLMENASRMCQNCKQFYATAATNYLCSTCFKKNVPASVDQKKPYKQPSLKESSAAFQEIKAKQPDNTRCFKCKKNIGLLGVNCKCGFTYCNKHRMPEQHDCGVDYRKIGQQQLSKKTQSVAPRKLSEI